MNPEDRKSLGKAGTTQEECILNATAKREKDLQDLLTSLLRLRGVEPIRAAFGKKTRITVGCPDIIFCYFGTPCMWEVKYEDGELSDEQESLHRRLSANGWRIFIVRSCEQGKKILDHIKENKPI